MPTPALTRDQVLALLASAPARIAALTAGTTAAQLRLQPAEGEWPATEVLAHLRACADVWGGCIARIITEGQPAIRHVSPRTWIRRTSYRDLDFAPSLEAYTRQRAELLALLEPLPAAGWLRTATVTGAGKRTERSVLDYSSGLAAHEQLHIAQSKASRRPDSGGVPCSPIPR